MKTVLIIRVAAFQNIWDEISKYQWVGASIRIHEHTGGTTAYLTYENHKP